MPTAPGGCLLLASHLPFPSSRFAKTVLGQWTGPSLSVKRPNSSPSCLLSCVQDSAPCTFKDLAARCGAWVLRLFPMRNPARLGSTEHEDLTTGLYAYRADDRGRDHRHSRGGC